ncbi:MAG: VOC family protein [Chloroflexota bacterium]|nr:VOC family protein [Chloroflexota bacterium]
MTRICVVSVYVRDIQEAREFYCDKLGFEVAREYGDCILQLENDGVTFVVEKIEGEYPDKPCTVIATQTDDLAGDMEKLRGLDVTFIHDTPQPFPEGVYAACRAPGDNILELVEFKE